MVTPKPLLLFEQKGGVGKITLNRPEKRNAINRQMVEELMQTYEEIRGDDSIRVVVTTGVGDTFSAGMDAEWLEALMAKSDDPRPLINLDPDPIILHLDEQIRHFPKPTIAAVNGYCLGAALTFLVAHDMILASEEQARFGLPEVIRGFTPRLVIGPLFRVVHMKYGFELMLTGRNWDARKAERAGLVSKVVPHDQLEEAAFDWANEIARWDPVTLDYCKRAAHKSMDQLTYLQAMEMSSYMHSECNIMNPKPYVGLREFVKGKGLKATIEEH